MAVVDYSNKQGQLPPALDYAFQAHEYQALPNQGGLREQPARLLLHMRVTYNVWKAISEYMSAPNTAQWAQNNRGSWEIVAEAFSIAEKHGKG